MEMVQEETRKGPWTEQEDMQLVCYVGLFGERRWDFIAKVSGLNRTGKSCRLRWVNYLHPGLKRGRLTPQEECLVLELHARWGNRWSRIARKLPGRTDNEIKNYWRTHMRKKAQEMKSYSCSSTVNTSEPPAKIINTERQESRESSGSSSITTCSGDNEVNLKGYCIDQIWNEIPSPESTIEDWNIPCPPAPPIWEYLPDTMWKIDAEEPKASPSIGCSVMVSNYQFGGEPCD